MQASLRDFYQKKIQRLQLDNLQLEEELLSLPRDQIHLKYQMLLDQLASQKDARLNQQQLKGQQHDQSLRSINQKWENRLQEKQSELSNKINSLKEGQKNLTIENIELKTKLERLQRELDDGDAQVFKLQLDGVKEDNGRLRKELAGLKNQCQLKNREVQQQADEKVEMVKERQKISYRHQIEELQNKIIQLQEQLQETRKKASPEREENLKEFHRSVQQSRQEQSRQIQQLTDILEKKHQEIFSLRDELERNKQTNVLALKEMSDQLKDYESRLFQKEFDREVELADLQREMGSKRQKQANDLKDELRRLEQGFERERSEWKQIIDQFQIENGKIKKDWQTEKQKYLEQKKRLKDKISDLRSRLKQKEDELNKNDNSKLLKELHEMDSNEQNFTSYENAITFMDRQVRVANLKITQKDTELNSLLQQLKLLQKESEKEITYARDKAREETKKLYDKIFKMEDSYDQLYVELRQKQKGAKRRQKDLQAQRQGHAIELQNFQNVIEEMQRDYDRVRFNKKSLEDSFRDERENVITGKLDLNVERKRKWDDMARQQRELQLVYRQKMNRMQSEHEVQLEQLRRDKHHIASEKEELKAVIEGLKDRFDVPKEHRSKQNQYSQYEGKLATLDLQIALKNNMFKNLIQTIAKGGSSHKKTQLQEISLKDSESMSESEKIIFGRFPNDGDVTPYYRSVEVETPGKADPFTSAQFSFCPPKQK